jgi:hypothetical protein
MEIPRPSMSAGKGEAYKEELEGRVLMAGGGHFPVSFP